MSRKHIVSAIYGFNALISIILGSIYLFRQSFMPYHQTAIGRNWAQLDPAMQTLFDALLDVAGAGWITLAIAVGVLITWPLQNGELWSRFLIPILFLIFYVPTLYATVKVWKMTPATPPWYGNLATCVTVLIAFIIDQPWKRY